MPTVTDPNTGEKREISMEEFMETVRGGGRLMGIQQVVTDAEGNQRVTDIFGNLSESDGFERSANIFFYLADMGVFLSQAVQGYEYDLDPDRVRDENVVITADLMDHPMTYILTCTPDYIRLEKCIRDEMRSMGNKELVKEWPLDGGELNITVEDLQNDKDLVIALVMAQIRKFIESEGILSRLKQMNNAAAGAQITVRDGEPSAKLVQGKTRPALPCAILGGLLGVETLRPYPDEFIGDAFMEEMDEDDLEEAAQAGDPAALERLALGYLNGDGVEQDFEKSAYWMEKLAELDSDFAQFNLGLFYAKGCGVQRDFKKAAYWMERAAENGDGDAPALAERFGKIDETLVKAEAGDAQAQADMAESLILLGGSLDQFGEAKDFAEGFNWARMAALKGNGDGMWALALCYEHGRGIPENKASAVKWFRKGADIGHPKCQQNLACYYMSGDVIQKDPKQAFELLMKSAEQGYGPAMRDVGRCYQFGHGVEDDMTKAIYWYEKALGVIDDPELEQKVAIFKMLEAAEPEELETEWQPPEGYEEALMSFMDEEISRQAKLVAKLMQVMRGSYDPDGELLTFSATVAGTQYEGRTERIEYLSVGDKVCLVREPNNESNANNVSVRNINGESLGNLHAGVCDVFAPVMDEDLANEITAVVEEVVPLSQRGARARKAELKVRITLHIPNIVDCVVCKLGGDQVRTWAQKLEAIYTVMPIDHAKLLFELYNRLNGEYDNLDEGKNDTSYAGLDNLEDEIRFARAKMQEERDPNLDYGRNGPDGYEEFGAYVQRMMAAEPARYGALQHYEIEEYDNLDDVFRRLSVDEKEYYWLDQTRVSEEEYRENEWFNHWYEVVELYEGRQLPVDLNDEEVVSIFGCGQFAAFADLSYGC